MLRALCVRTRRSRTVLWRPSCAMPWPLNSLEQVGEAKVYRHCKGESWRKSRSSGWAMEASFVLCVMRRTRPRHLEQAVLLACGGVGSCRATAKQRSRPSRTHPTLVVGRRQQRSSSEDAAFQCELRRRATRCERRPRKDIQTQSRDVISQGSTCKSVSFGAEARVRVFLFVWLQESCCWTKLRMCGVRAMPRTTCAHVVRFAGGGGGAFSCALASLSGSFAVPLWQLFWPQGAWRSWVTTTPTSGLVQAATHTGSVRGILAGSDHSPLRRSW